MGMGLSVQPESLSGDVGAQTVRSGDMLSGVEFRLSQLSLTLNKSGLFVWELGVIVAPSLQDGCEN
jgi:hypothetical protein